MFYWLSLIVGKCIRLATRVRGGGSALPGLVVERLNPHFVSRALRDLPHGVIVISGTNGKTTTTKIVTELLEGQGLTVFTNRSGSNFIRGVISALLGELTLSGKLKADVAVLELDEAHAVHFVREVPPRYSLLLNVLRDQLDRFGEIDATVRLLETIAKAATETVIVNREDTMTLRIGETLRDTQHIVAYGLAPELRSFFPSDDELYRTKEKVASALDTTCVLEHFSGNTATFSLDGNEHTTELKLTGIYNTYNAAAALCLVHAVLGPHVDSTQLFTALSAITPAFGRGETVMLGNTPIELVLVKNPSGFRLALNSFSPSDTSTMIAINDAYADGRDVSWLWDVDFSSLADSESVATSGTRAYDIALRLDYDSISLGAIETNITAALTDFLETNPNQPKRIYCTYTAMLAIREHLGTLTNVSKGVSA